MWMGDDGSIASGLYCSERTKGESRGASLFNDEVEDIARRWQEMTKTLG